MTPEELHDNLKHEARTALEEWARLVRCHDCADHRNLLDKGNFTIDNLNAHTHAWEAHGRYVGFETACHHLRHFIEEQHNED